MIDAKGLEWSWGTLVENASKTLNVAIQSGI